MFWRNFLFLCLALTTRACLFADDKISPLANQGHPHARLALERMYREGKGEVTRQSHEQALASLQAAYNGSKSSLDRTWIEAATELGLLYMDKLFTGYSLSTAYNYCNEAAGQWSGKAMYLIGSMYEQGGTAFPIDYAQAVDWYLKAIDNGSITAKTRLKYMIDNDLVPYDKLSAARAPLNRDERIESYMTNGATNPSVNKIPITNRRISASTGQVSPDSAPERPYDQISLGRRYELGQDLEKNINMALKWYERAANADHPLAQEILGNIYAGTRSSINPDPVLALKWLSIAASNPKAGTNTTFYALKAAEIEKNLSFTGRNAAAEKIKLWKAQNRTE